MLFLVLFSSLIVKDGYGRGCQYQHDGQRHLKISEIHDDPIVGARGSAPNRLRVSIEDGTGPGYQMNRRY